MISSPVALVALLSSFATTNGVVIQRDTSTTTMVTTASVPATPPTTVSSAPTATPTSGGGVSCNNAQNWQPAFAYVTGAQAIFNNELYTAKQWTYNNSPTAHPDQWRHVDTCSQPINNKANCTGIFPWSGNVAYTTGNKVTFESHLWSAVQWAYANHPSDASGIWQDIGACA